ncbi:MAG: 23S rRNA (adenine(2030)-N(6))-methyltransferase RlmJ [Treponema sp.]|nr:23S rRNA (adenine(2030)-N(6))-methyltransferase RlmJ [Treponema sp.]
MFSYRHAFHAGNHADILKHSVLVHILDYLKKKEKPFTVFDTHAGAGWYDLHDERLEKTQEAQKGIQLLLSKEQPELTKSETMYYNICRLYANHGKYPGSPEIERCLMRPDDMLILSEFHNTEITVLKEHMAQQTLLPTSHSIKPAIHHRDGYEMVKALTPPLIKRGLVLIDPSYEEDSDYTNTAQTVAIIHKKWSAGIIAVWYPLLSHRKNEIATMKRIMQASAQAGTNQSETLDLQLQVMNESAHTETSLQEAAHSSTPRLYGSGMFIINPPYTLQSDMEKVITYMTETLHLNP